MLIDIIYDKILNNNCLTKHNFFSNNILFISDILSIGCKI